MRTKNLGLLFIIIILLLSEINCSTDNTRDSTSFNVQTVEFENVNTNEADSTRTLKSFKREDDLFMMTYYGDYNSRLDELNEKIITEGIDSVVPPDDGFKYECSIFTAFGNPGFPIFGRNFDNNIPRGVLVGLYSPPDGYRSVCLSRMSDMGFDKGEDPTLLPLENRQLLLNSVFFIVDGMNERGVSIALATGETAVINRDENKKLIFITYLLREVLDYSKNVEQAIEIVKSFDVFDVDTARISNHLLISGPDGSSVVAEYTNGEWKFLPNDRPWQIATNSLLFSVSEVSRRSECWRYRTADDYLEQANGSISWEEGLNILESISVSDTQWSSLYNMNNKEIYISLYRNFIDIFQLKL